MVAPADDRRVALIKSLATNNRFYCLVEPNRGIRNADTVTEIPGDLLLGIAYPCLEDGLNDFAVIRTTFETLDLFPSDDPIRGEMMEIIHDARGNLLRRLHELREKFQADKAHFLGTEYTEFKSYALDIAHRGCPRRNLDSMMKLNVFNSVAEAEGQQDGGDLRYYFEFNYANGEQLTQLAPRQFIVALFDEVLNSVKDDANYKNKYLFDRNVFQKFIAVMFVNYATTDPMFYGINKKDYGVSGERDMENTPLYVAIGKELRAIEESLGLSRSYAAAPTTRPSQPAPPHPITTSAPQQAAAPDFSSAVPLSGAASALPSETARAGLPNFEQASSFLPAELVNQEVLLGPITSLCSAASLLMRKNDPETQRFARVIIADASKVVQELKRLGIISHLVNDPGACGP